MNGKNYKSIYDVTTLPLPLCRDKHYINYINVPVAFDIETSKCNEVLLDNHPVSYMYIWQFAIKYENNYYIQTGRTWDDFLSFINILIKELELSKKKRLVIYVHNLYYEFQFMKNFFKWDTIFARKQRHVLRALTDQGIEFRCSYILSNKNLAKCLEECKSPYQKMIGDLDYNITRTPETKLTPKEYQYAINDVLGLVDYIEYKMEKEADNLATIPMTSTGYIRRMYRKAMQSNPKNRRRFEREALTLDQYYMCREAFRGGDTHANYNIIGEHLLHVDSMDKKSSYPAVIMTEKFPGKFVRGNVSRFSDYLNEGCTALLFRLRLDNVTLYPGEAMPYIPISKVIKIERPFTVDNGRIISAKSLTITVTDIDYKIIMESYLYTDKYIKDLYISPYKLLPKELRQTLLELFMGKESIDKNDPEKEYDYMKAKNGVNGTYGMMVTDILMDDIIFNYGEWSKKKPENPAERLEKYYKNKNSFLSYQWGVWVTAYARKALRDGLKLCGNKGYYCDTDSVKGRNIATLFTGLNQQLEEKAEHADIPAYVVVNGEKRIMGVWEHEYTYDDFVTLGAKRYIGLYADKKGYYYHTTISGVSKTAGENFIKLRGPDAFVSGACINPSGKLKAHYNDTNDIFTITVEGVEIKTSSYLTLEDSSYILNLTDDFERFVNLIKNGEFYIDLFQQSMVQ